jgi:hypothetical protein
MPDDTLLTGNTRGELVLWAPVPSEDGTLDFMQVSRPHALTIQQTHSFECCRCLFDDVDNMKCSRLNI